MRSQFAVAGEGVAVSVRMNKRERVFAALSILIGTACALVVAELGLRLLPVNDGLLVVPVTEADPVFHFVPNQRSTWSLGWNFSRVNRLQVNNAGYANDQEYDRDDPRRLLAVVGDSYVQASMIPYHETLQGRLAAMVAPDARVYSFGASGAPLSQYLVWAREAREQWKAQALAIIVVGNDFDESLAIYRKSPGFHHYISDPDGSLKLQLVEYRPGRLRFIAEHSALVRYLIFNMQVLEHLRGLAESIRKIGSAAAETYVGNTSAEASADRMRWSEAAVRTFLRDLGTFSGWRPEQVVFVVDGFRYPPQDTSMLSSYFARMRSYFLAEARRAGYEVIDMDTIFMPRFSATGERYEFPNDGHWNGLAHGLAAGAVGRSQLFFRWRGGQLGRTNAARAVPMRTE
jgi:hypothetical protein